MERGDPFDLTRALNDSIKPDGSQGGKSRPLYFMPNEMPQHSGKLFKQGMGIDFYVD